MHVLQLISKNAFDTKVMVFSLCWEEVEKKRKEDENEREQARRGKKDG